MSSLADRINKYVLSKVSERDIEKDMAMEILRLTNHKAQDNDVAIIGMSCRFPGADSLDEYWNMLKNGISSIRDCPEDRKRDLEGCLQNLYGNKNINDLYVKAGYLKSIDEFDPGFFRISPKEAEFMDPAQRLFLQVAYESIEDSGYGGKKLVGTQTGVFVGKDHTHRSLYSSLVNESDPLAVTGSVPGILASRIAYILNLRGPAVVFDTACSSGLVALHFACRSLIENECEMAIAGGINIEYPRAINNDLNMIESEDCCVRAFDKDANGTAWGEGVGAFILKPLKKALQDNDSIYAVIKGSAINNDGMSNGITAPNADAQEEVIVRAWENGNIDPETISYVEAHGTGTKLGDPIELKALNNAFKRFTDNKLFCGIGSVKTNIGHSVAASGIASVMKVVLALKNGQIPPSLNYKEPNPFVDFSKSAVYVVDKLKNWERGNLPRRAGVSAFGFSGTNCHIVLEEAPVLAEKEEGSTITGFEVFTISAKSKDTLSELVCKYYNYLDSNFTSNLRDICYTANTGRGHYSHRLAVIADKPEILKEKLKVLIDAGVGGREQGGIFYGQSKEAVEIKRGRAGLLNTEEKTDTGLDKHMCNYEEYDLRELCRNYVNGTDIDWQHMYNKCDCKRLNLPVYPFEHLRCWPADRYESMQSNFIKNSVSTFLDVCLTKSYNCIVYLTEFSPLKQWVLKEHRVYGNNVIPGTTYIEMAVESCSEFLCTEGIQIKNLVFLTPIVMESDEIRNVHTIINKKDDFFEFVIASEIRPDVHGKESSWIKHAEGRICNCVKHSEIKENYVGLLDNCSQELLLERDQSKGAFSLGARWQNAKKLMLGENEAVVEIELPKEYVGDTLECFIHPALFDMAMNIVGQRAVKDTYLPLAYKSIEIYGTLPDKFYCHLKWNSPLNNDTEVLNFDALLFDNTNRLIVRVDGYSIKRALESEFRKGYVSVEDKKNIFHHMVWLERKTEEKPERASSKGGILVFKDNSDIWSRTESVLRSSGSDIFEVEIGEAYNRKTEKKYTVGPSEDDYIALIDSIKKKGISDIIFILSIKNENIDSIEKLNNIQNKGVHSLFYLCRALVKNKMDKGLNILVVSDNVYQVTKQERRLNPLGGQIFGLGKVMGSENPGMNIRCIDIDDDTDAGIILDELYNKFGDVQLTAYRNGKAYTEELTKLSVEDLPDRKLEITKNGVYIITGGTGGIGLEVGKFLAAENCIKLVLISRNGLPDREEWDDILRCGNEEALCKKISAVKAIEENGTEVRICKVDVTNYDEMKAVFADIRETYGKINGVIHSAGQAGNGFIIRKDKDVFGSVIDVKVKGAWILNELTKDEPLDFMLLFSSVVTLLSEAGQGDYTAGNSYLDALAAYRNSKGMRTFTINWAAWKETGMAVNYGFNNDGREFLALSTKDAIDALHKLINKDIGRVAVGYLNPEKKGTTTLQQIQSPASAKKNENSEQRQSGVELTGKEQFTRTERLLAQIWSETLGVHKVDVFDNFYLLGGDSIQAIKIANLINDRMDVEIDMSDLFEYLTVSELATFIDSQNNENAAVEHESEGIPVVSKPELYDLSYSQKRIWFLQKLTPDLYAYNIPARIYIDEKFDANHMQNALDGIVKRHESLRTVIIEENGEPKQIISGECYCGIQIIDLSNAENKEEEIEEYVTNDNRQIFDLSECPIRAKVFILSHDRFCLYLNIHHIVTDGWSMGIIAEEMRRSYSAALHEAQYIPELFEARYMDFVNEQNNIINSPKIKEFEKYWLSELEKPLPVLNLPTDFKRPQKQTYNGSYVNITLDGYLTSQLMDVAVRLNTTLPTIFLSAYFIFLYRISTDSDIIVGMPIAGRNNKKYENVVGLFINTLCIRVNLEGITTFEELVDEVKRKNLLAFKNREFPFDLLVNKINPERDLSRSPIFSSLFQFYDNIPQNNEGVTLYDLNLMCRENSGKIEIRMEYNTDLFKRETIDRFLGYLGKIVSSLPEIQDTDIRDIDILSEKEKHKVLYEFNETKVDYQRNKTVHKMFEEQADRTPDNIAVVFGDRQMTYSELNERSNQLASVLRKKGVKQDDIVPLLVERSVEMIIAILGILKAGGAYLPIDHEYPDARIEYILNDCEASIVVTQKSLERRLEFCKEKKENTIDVIKLDDEGLFTGEEIFNLESACSSDNLAYIIYTSGTTGNPKGVMIEHRAVANLIKGITDNIEFRAGKTILVLTSISFDIFVVETLLSLTNGLRLVIADAEQQRDPKLLAELIIKNNVNMLQTTPSRLQMLLMSGVISRLHSLSDVLIGGEALQRNILEGLSQLHDIRIYNIYGPTETTVYSTIQELTPDSEEITIGKPLSNTQAYILGFDGKPQPIGVAGELCISGDGLARGYCRRKELTAEKFVPNPFIGGRMYRTGDIARWLPDGRIDYMGRIDHQVKIRGYRIELGEIENLILKYDSVKEAVVAVKQDKANDKVLVAYFVAASRINLFELKQYLTDLLPYYMVPAFFVQLDSIPTNHNGKVDRKALPELPELRMSKDDYEAPENDMEKTLVEIWSSVLDVSNIGVNDSFFDLGGHSLLIVKVEVEMEKRGLQIDYSDIYTHKTVRELASFISSKEKPENESQFFQSLQYGTTENPYNLTTVIDGNSDIKNNFVTVASESAVILNNIRPFNDFFYKSCFYNSLFPVMEHFGISLLPVIANGVFVYRIEEKDGCRTIDVIHEFPTTTGEICNELGLGFKAKAFCEDIAGELENSIDMGNPVVIGVDCYYESIRPDTYLKKHWPHTILVYGYDRPNRTFNVVEHLKIDNLSYEQRIISYDDAISSYNGLLNNFIRNNNSNSFVELINGFSGTSEAITCCKFYSDGSGVSASGEDVLSSFSKNMHLYRESILKGISDLKEYIAYYKQISCSEEYFEINSNDIVQKLNNIINSKLVEKYLITNIMESNPAVTDLLQMIIRNWDLLRRIIAKYQFSRVYRENDIEQTIKYFDSILDLENRYTEKLFELLDY